MSCATWLGAALTSAHIPVGHLVVHVGPRPWPVESRRTAPPSREDHPGSRSLHNAFSCPPLTCHTLFNEYVHASLYSRCWGHRLVTKTLCQFPCSCSLQSASPSINLALSLGDRKGSHCYSHIVDDKANVLQSILPHVMKQKRLDSNLGLLAPSSVLFLLYHLH